MRRYAADGRLCRIRIGGRLARYTAESLDALLIPENEQSPDPNRGSTHNSTDTTRLAAEYLTD
jgi:hypothetical protein